MFRFPCPAFCPVAANSMRCMDSPSALADVYELPAEHKDFRDTIRQIVTEKVAPRAAEIGATAAFPWDNLKIFADQGLMGLPFPEEYGGTGTGTLMLNVAIEEIARACAS